MLLPKDETELNDLLHDIWYSGKQLPMAVEVSADYDGPESFSYSSDFGDTTVFKYQKRDCVFCGRHIAPYEPGTVILDEGGNAPRHMDCRDVT